MNLKNVMLSKRSSMPTSTYCVIPFIRSAREAKLS